MNKADLVVVILLVGCAIMQGFPLDPQNRVNFLRKHEFGAVPAERGSRAVLRGRLGPDREQIVDERRCQGPLDPTKAASTRSTGQHLRSTEDLNCASKVDHVQNPNSLL